MYARYGESSFKYGNSTRLYGLPGTLPTSKLWAIEIDWDGDGTYNGDNEALYCIGLSTDRGFSEVYAINGEGYFDHFAPPLVGTCTLTLSNHTGRYDLWDSSGAPSTTIRPGVLARVRVREGYSATDAPVFAGIVTDIRPNEANKTATITIQDGISVLQDREAQIRFGSSDITDGNLDAVLDNIGWEWGYNEEGANFNPYFFTNGRAFDIVHNLTRVGAQVFYTDGAGDLYIDYVLTALHASTDTTYQIDVSNFLKPLELSVPWKNLATRVREVTYSYTTGTTDTVIWQQGADTYEVDALSTEELWIDYSYNSNNQHADLFFAVPNDLVSSSDYVVNSSSDGLGSNLTGSVTVSVTDYSKRAMLTIVNSSTDAGFFTTFQVRGTPYTAQKAAFETTLTDYLNIGTKLFVIDTPYINDLSKRSADSYLYLGYPHNQKVVQARLRSNSYQFARDLNALVEFSSADFADNVNYITPKVWNAFFTAWYNQFRIMRIRHRWVNDNGQDVETTWDLRHVLQNVAPDIF